MQERTSQTNFSFILNSQTNEWRGELMRAADHAFQYSDDRSRLLGNLLVMEQYINTLRQGLSASGKTLSAGLECADSILWDYLNCRTTSAAFEDFANDYYDCLLAYNIGDVTTDAPKEFYSKYFSGADPDAYELLAIEWSSGLLMQLVSIAGGRIDFDDFEGYEKIDFYGIDIMIGILEDACVGLIGASRSSDTYSANATETLTEKALTETSAKQVTAQVHCSPLFQGIVQNVQNCLQTALNASPDTFESLHYECSQYTILPKEYASALLLE